MSLNRTLAPDHKAVEELNLVNPEKATLDNGIPVYFISGGNEDVIRLELVFDAGSWNQEELLQASFTNRLLLGGTGQKTSDQIAEAIDFYGAFIQTQCTADKATLTLYTLNKYFAALLDLLQELLTASSFPLQEIDLLKTEQWQQLQINQNRNSFLVGRHFNAALFGDKHPYGRFAQEENFKNLSREHLLSFFESFYKEKPFTIFLSGQVSPESISALNKALGSSTHPSVVKHPSHEEESGLEGLKNSFFQRDGSVQAAIRIGKKTIDRSHKDFSSLQLLNLILGGYFGSRLMKNIREEKGLTYGIHSTLQIRKQATTFYIATEVNNDLREVAVSEILKEIRHLQQEPVGSAELDIAKNYLMGALLRNLDGPFAQMERYASLYAFGLDLNYYDQWIADIKQANAETLMSIAQEHLAESDLLQVVVGSSSDN